MKVLQSNCRYHESRRYDDVLEIGPEWVLINILDKTINTYVIEIDTESVDYLDEIIQN
jgi:16S rRNA A1518/A1519 N6-dimethyltransferase RsmA/KsgA/DIM1 with predicted DNA glycosylase/AP lyase activity